MKQIITLILVLSCINAIGQIGKYNFTVRGMSKEYSDRFLTHKKVITDGINSLNLPSSFFPVDILVNYENGEGIVTISAQYNHDDIFKPESRYARINLNRRIFGEGITFILPRVLVTILQNYKFNVATNGSYNVDTDILNFKSSVQLNCGKDFIQIFAHDEYDDMRCKTYFYSNVILKFDNHQYSIEPKNIISFNDIDFFYIGKTIGLDGKKTPYYYLSKFFKIDEWTKSVEEKSTIQEPDSDLLFKDKVDIAKRQLVNYVVPTYESITEGIVVVEILVDRYGNVIKAEPGAKGTTCANRELFEASKGAALESKFNEDLTAPELQKGYMTYRFTLH